LRPKLTSFFQRVSSATSGSAATGSSATGSSIFGLLDGRLLGRRVRDGVAFDGVSLGLALERNLLLPHGSGLLVGCRRLVGGRLLLRRLVVHH